MGKLHVVDKAERESIRHALKRYKEMHGGIGDPELQQRISLALDLDSSGVPLATLQRFLRGKGRTEDLMVRRYQKFLSIVAPPASADEVGTALAAFLRVNRREEGWISHLGGYYRAYVRPYTPLEDPSPAGDSGDLKANAAKVYASYHARENTPPFEMPYSILKFEAGGSPDCMNVKESIFNPGREPTALSFPDALPAAVNTGVITPVDRSEFLIIVRSFLRAHLYAVSVFHDEPLTLRGVAIELSRGLQSAVYSAKTLWNPVFEIELRRGERQ